MLGSKEVAFLLLLVVVVVMMEIVMKEGRKKSTRALRYKTWIYIVLDLQMILSDEAAKTIIIYHCF